MNNRVKKLIAPIIITILLILYFIAIMLSWIFETISFTEKLIGGFIVLALIGVSIFVLIERIKEIRSGEEDDLSKY